MVIRGRQNPVNYALCNQTVTVYHKEGSAITKTIYKNAFLDFKKTETTQKTGSRDGNSFLLVIPGSTQAVQAKDKVFLGEGPDILTAAAWAEFIPAKVNGLVVVEYVDCKYWDNVMVHTEAGG